METLRNPGSLKKILLVFPLLFLLELVFGEAGRWLEVGGLSIRKVLFVLSVLSLYGYAALSWRSLRFARIDLAVLFFLVINSIWGILVPALYERSLGLAFADFGAVYILLLYFPLAGILRADEMLWSRIKVIFVGAILLLALAQVFVWVLGTGLPRLVPETVEFFKGFYEVPNMTIGPVPDGFFRVMPITAISLIPAFFLLSYALVRNYRPRIMALLLFLISCAVVVSYTRTFWLALVFGMLLVGGGLVLKWRSGSEPKRLGPLLRELAPALMFITAFIFIMAVDSRIELAHEATSGQTPSRSNQAAPEQEDSLSGRAASTFDSEDTSISIRMEQLPYLVESWKNAPIFGQGFGASAEGYVRSNSNPFTYEFVAPSLLMKLGVVGSALWLTPLVYVLVNALRRVRVQEGTDRIRFAAASFLSFGLVVQANPWLFNFVGMFILLFYLLEFGLLKHGQPCLKRLVWSVWPTSERMDDMRQFESGR